MGPDNCELPAYHFVCCNGGADYIYLVSKPLFDPLFLVKYLFTRELHITEEHDIEAVVLEVP